MTQRSPAIAYGTRRVQHAHELLPVAARRAVLVCGQRSFEASGAAAMVPGLRSRVEVQRWSNFRANTDIEDLRAGLDVMADFKPDVVIGVGGGSAMDMAKLLCAYEPSGPPLEEQVRGSGTIESHLPHLMLVPTTSGSGSEATHFAVLYIGAEKLSVAGPGMRADSVILDPLLALSGSDHQRATSGIDAVCQSIESLWAVGATPFSRRAARHALGLLTGAIETFVHSPDEASARAMCLGSHLAGRAIDISKTTAAHALSYGITKSYGIDHGSAVALTLGAFIRAHAEAEATQLRPSVDEHLHRQAMAVILRRLGASDGRAAARAFAALLDRLDLPSTLTAAGVQTRDQVQALVSVVNLERLGNNPVELDQSEMIDLILPG